MFVFQIVCTRATGAVMTSGRKLEGRIPVTGTSTPSPTLFHGSQVSLSSDFGLTLDSELHWNLYLHPLDVKPENNANISRYLRFSRAWGTILSTLHRNHQFSFDCCYCTIVHYAILASLSLGPRFATINIGKLRNLAPSNIWDWRNANTFVHQDGILSRSSIRRGVIVGVVEIEELFWNKVWFPHCISFLLDCNDLFIFDYSVRRFFGLTRIWATW